MSDRSFEPELVAIMGRAFDEAWAELEAKSLTLARPEMAGIKRALALRIISAVRVGQRDPERLRAVALHVVEGCRITRVADRPTLT